MKKEVIEDFLRYLDNDDIIIVLANTSLFVGIKPELVEEKGGNNKHLYLRIEITGSGVKRLILADSIEHLKSLSLVSLEDIFTQIHKLSGNFLNWSV